MAISAALEEKYNNEFLRENGAEVHEVSVKLGQDVADKILAWSETDGGKDAQFDNFPKRVCSPIWGAILGSDRPWFSIRFTAVLGLKQALFES